jgi:hypothetical protein
MARRERGECLSPVGVGLRPVLDGVALIEKPLHLAERRWIDPRRRRLRVGRIRLIPVGETRIRIDAPSCASLLIRVATAQHDVEAAGHVSDQGG